MELMAVTAIIVIVSAIVLANNNRFGGTVLLENLAYDVALSVREAQVYGISVTRFGADTFSAGYGLHFNISDPTHYLLFADAVDPNGLYDCPTPGSSVTCELVRSTAITRGYQVSDLCYTPSMGSQEVCNSTDGSVQTIDVLFERPNPDALISADGISCLTEPNACASQARIVLSSPQGDTRSVIIYANGQISVEK